MPNQLNVIGFAGSLRKGSYNMALLRAAKKLAPENVNIEIADISVIPTFNQDLELEDVMPESVKALKAKVEKADAVLFSSPEYNYSIPGVLKNVIDWLSRPYGKNSLEEKPVAIMGTSTGMLGASRAQYHLRQCFVFLNGFVMNKPEMIVPTATDKFDADGNLTDEKTKAKLKEMLDALVIWADRVKKK
jgi:chromate reductase